MASGDTNVTVCNQALNLLGAVTLSSFSDTTNDAATVCNNIYETVIRQTLSMYPWSFAMTKVQLSRSATTPVNEWAYQYDLHLLLYLELQYKFIILARQEYYQYKITNYYIRPLAQQ